jgi:peptide/nickel transport system permease protein
LATQAPASGVPDEIAPVQQVAAGRRGRSWRRLLANPMAVSGLSIIGLFVLIAILAPLLERYNPTAINPLTALLPPGPHHWLGTDDVGMDVYSRTIAATRTDLGSALVVVLAAGITGTVLGTLSGWLGGWWDEVLMRITDMFLAFPALILAMAISAVLTPDLLNALLAISVTFWPIYARLARAQVLVVKRLEFVEAARSIAAPTWRVLGRHVLPNSLTPMLVQATLDMGNVLLTAAGLSFIGFGAQPPTPEWGLMVAQGQQYLMQQWWISTVPAVAIFLLVMGFNQLGDALRDALDPRLGQL